MSWIDNEDHLRGLSAIQACRGLFGQLMLAELWYQWTAELWFRHYLEPKAQFLWFIQPAQSVCGDLIRLNV